MESQPISEQATSGRKGSIHQNVGDVAVGDNSNVNISIGLGVDEQQRNVIALLAPWTASLEPDSQPSLLAKLKREYASGTGQWLLKTLSDWLDVPDGPDRSLWVHGEVGCGKSMLCFSAIWYLWQKSRHDKARYKLAYAIHSHDLRYSHDPDFLIRSTLAFLAEMEPLPPELAKWYSETKSLGTPEWDELLELVIIGIDSRLTHVATAGRPSVLVLVVDAIDEIPTERARAVALRFFDRLHGINKRTKRFKIRIVSFTRTGTEVEAYCRPAASWQESDWHEIAIERENIESDMTKAMLQRLKLHRKLSKLSPEESSALATQLANKADGMFLLASLYAETLEQCNISRPTALRLQKELRNIPPGLYPRYDQIIGKIGSETIRGDVLAALRFILYAAGPVYIEDVIDACATLSEGEQGELFEEELRLEAEDLEQHLTGLVSFRPPLAQGQLTGTRIHQVAFRHYSVAEYLRNDDKARPWHVYNGYFGAEKAQLHITQVCLAYLAFCHQKKDDKLEFPLQIYAWCYWSRHAAAYLALRDETSALGSNKAGLPQSSHADMERTPPSNFALRIANSFLLPAVYDDVALTDRILERTKQIVGNLECYNQNSFAGVWDQVLSNPYFLSELTTKSSVNATHEGIKSYDIDSFGDSRSLEKSNRLSSATRFVVIEPAAEVDALLQCWLLTDSLDNQPSYSALSYEWGYRGWQVFNLSGSEKQITGNLHQALLRMRSPSSRRVIWADALSIFMEDMNDRLYQISQMESIYTKAREVITWLGEGDEDVVESIEDINMLGLELFPNNAQTQTQTTEDEYWRLSVSTRLSGRKRGLGIQSSARISDRALNDIFGCSVWSRAWLIQENALASRLFIQSGSRRTSWQLIEAVSRVFAGWNKIYSVNPHAISESRFTRSNFLTLQRVRNRATRPKLPELLWLSRHHRCSLPQDKVFSLIGLLNGEERRRCDQLRDYRKTVEDVFMELTFEIICLYKSLDVLSLVDRTSDNYAAVEEGRRERSWVPNWNGGLPDVALATGPFLPQQLDLFRAGTCSPEASLEASRFGNDSLQVRGVILQPIVQVYPIPRTPDPYSAEHEIHHFANDLTDLSSGLYGHVFPLSCIMTPKQILDKQSSAIATTEGIFKRWNSTVAVDRNARSTILETQLEMTKEGRRLMFQTEGGCSGCGPIMAEPNDVVAILLGAQVPFILRACDGGYQLMGECFFEGVMDGEIMKELELNQRQATEILLI